MRIFLGPGFTECSQFLQERLDLGRVLFDGVELLFLKLGQVLRMAGKNLKGKVNLLETIVQKMEDKPEEVRIEAEFSFSYPFDNLSFSFVVSRHLNLYRQGARKGSIGIDAVAPLGVVPEGLHQADEFTVER